MQKESKDMISKIMMRGAVFLFLYPIVIVARVDLFRVNFGVDAFVISLLLMMGGMGIAAWLMAKHSGISWFGVMYSTMLLPVILGYVLYGKIGAWRLLFEIVVQTLFYFIGLRGYFKDTANNTSKAGLITALIVFLTTITCTYYMPKLSSLKYPFFFFAYAYLFLYMKIKSRENLKFIFEQRGVAHAEVRGRIRKDSNLTVVVIFLVILLFSNFQSIMAFVLKIAALMIVQITLFLLWIMGALFPMGKGQSGSGLGQELPPVPESQGNPWLNLLGILLFIAVVIFITVKLAPLFYKKLKEMFRWIYEKISALFSNQEGKENAAWDEYVETTQIIKKLGIVKEIGKENNNLKSLLKLLQTTHEPIKKVRLIYRILLILWKQQNIPIEHSDTTTEIYQKAMHMEGIGESLPIITSTYNKVRYGGVVPLAGEIEGLQGRFEEVRKQLNQRKSKKDLSKE